MSLLTAHMPARPRRAKRVRYTYDSDSELEIVSPPLSRSSRPPRTSNRVQTYREDSDESESSRTTMSSENLSDHGNPMQQVAPIQRQSLRNKIGKRSKIQTRQNQNKIPMKKQTRSFATFKRQKPIAQDGVVKVSSKSSFPVEIINSGKVPPWQQLPYHVLQSIMKYAAYPLYEETSRSTSSISWLCATSTLCKSFYEACIAALLYSPPLYPSFRAHGLLSLLKQDQNSTLINYRNKIKCLNIEVKNLLIRKSGINLDELLISVPLLSKLRLYHNHDDLQHKFIWAQPSLSKGKWSYPDNMFHTLDNHNVVLESFEWNGRFPKSIDVLNMLSEAHTHSCTLQLRDLSFINLTLPDRSSDEEFVAAGARLSSSFVHLTQLRHLCFRNCNIITNSAIADFPPALSSLEFSNCPSLTSPIMEKYLSEKGSSLTSLRVCGNQAMSLGFLANLRSLCPRLQKLQIDLTYTDPTSYRDRDPLYDELLPDGPPTWPSSLISVEIENLRQLSGKEAEEFFTSLVEAAKDLPHLKILIIKAILKNASWRDRAEMRKKWMPRLQHVFLNTAVPNSRSTKTQKPKPKPKSKPVNPSSRQSSRIAKNQLVQSDSSDDSNESNSHSSEVSHRDALLELPRQGRCDIVQLMISDQRPAQDQFHENDFLDDEPSGDEEWTGRNEEASGYAW